MLLNDKAKLEQVATEVMKQLDVDGSGKLEFPEVKKMIDDFTKGAPHDKRPTENEIKEAFKKLDTDGSGSLELPELIPLVKGII